MSQCAGDTSLRHREMPAPDQLHIQDHVVRGGKGTGHDAGGAVAGAAGDAIDEYGSNFDCAHIRG